MSYDLYFWRRVDEGLTPGSAYLYVVENLPCPGLELLDWDALADEARRLMASEREDMPVTFSFDERHLSASIGWSMQAEVCSLLGDWAAEKGLEVFDPQRQQPTDADASRVAGVRARIGDDEREEELARWRAGAKQGDPSAMLALGLCFAFGDRVDQSWPAALHWFRRAADLGHLPAIVELAECYRFGRGLAADPAAAVQLYEQAFEGEQCVSAYALGEMYAAGEGVPRDLDKAARYLKAARANRHPDAYAAMQKLGIDPE